MGLFPCSPSPTCPCGACPFSLLWAAHDSAQGHIALLLLQGIRQEHSAPLPCRESDIVVWLGTRCCLHRSLSLSVRLSLAAPHLCLSFSTGSSVDAGASTLGMCFKYEYQGVPFPASVPAVEQSSDRMEVRILNASCSKG